MPQVSREYSRIPMEHRPGSVISPSQGESQVQSENQSTHRLRLPTKSTHTHMWLLSLPLVVAVLSSRTSEVQQIHRLAACGQHPSLHLLCVCLCSPWVEEAAALKVLLMPPPGLHRLCILLADLEREEVYVALSSHCLQLVSPQNRPRFLCVGGLFGKRSRKFWWVNGEEKKSGCGVLTSRLFSWSVSTQSPKELKETESMKQAVCRFLFQVPSLSVTGLNLGALTPCSSVLFRCPQDKRKPRQFNGSRGHFGSMVRTLSALAILRVKRTIQKKF